MNRKLPTPRDYVLGTALLLALAIPVGTAVVAISAIYWTSRGIRALCDQSKPLEA